MSKIQYHNSPIYRGWTSTKGPNCVPPWVVSVSSGGSSVPVVAEIAPEWAASAPGAGSGLIWDFGAETDFLSLQCVIPSKILA